jgi:hypothetical protein
MALFSPFLSQTTPRPYLSIEYLLGEFRYLLTALPLPSVLGCCKFCYLPSHSHRLDYTSTVFMAMTNPFNIPHNLLLVNRTVTQHCSVQVTDCIVKQPLNKNIRWHGNGMRFVIHSEGKLYSTVNTLWRRLEWRNYINVSVY